MTKLKNFLKSMAYLGTAETYLIVEKSAIALVNMISIFSIGVLLTASVINFIYSPGEFYFSILYLFLFLLPLFLNYKKRHDLAKIVTLGIFLSGIYIGTFVMKFGGYFQFTIILPVSLYFLLFVEIRGWRFYSMLSMAGLYIAFNVAEFFLSDSVFTINTVIDFLVYLGSLLVFILALIFFIKKINLSEDLLKAKLRFENAIAEFSQAILTHGSNGIKRGLGIVLNASKVSRIYIFELSNDGGFISQTYEACAQGVKPEIDNPELQQIPVSEPIISRWVENFKQKQIIKGPVEDFPPLEKEVLMNQGILSILVIPIYSGNEWVGFIGFDDVYEKRTWDRAFIGLLYTIADIIGLHMWNVKNQEQIMRQNEELQILNATKDKFFSIVAHDLKSPFNSLIGFSDLLEQEVKKSDNRMIKQFSHYINKGLLQSYDYLSNLLEWSRIQSKRIEYRPTEFRLDHLVQEATDMLFIQAQSKDIKLRVSVPPELKIVADLNMIRTVIVNMVSNAIKYSEKGEEVKIISECRPEHVSIQIVDNGVGISSEMCEKLFSIEGSSSTPGTNNETGTGLGLIICKELIGMHRGAIRVDSEKNKGSVFQILLPVGLN
ncbi:GAF domain-containing sensor histidine kinase [uncultured Draconibacterium sp.]|uniref:GAF domain-containing sensor histidine kinase n=1 Tax=uncultured Draconibacterium sp. TaxID=1573823 RepID=UPI0029C93EBC|nr:GAF domain-containing sensor histidine kinase [uncultured Draconibacterium sp.]